MTNAWRRMAVAAVMAATVAGCSSKDSTGPTEAPNVGGLILSVTGATNTIVTGALPTADASFLPPVLSVNQPPSSTVPAAISVGAAEPFTTVMILPAGSTSYLRITLPAATQLISVKALTSATAASISSAVIIAVGNGTRSSRSAQLSLINLAN